MNTRPPSNPASRSDSPRPEFSPPSRTDDAGPGAAIGPLRAPLETIAMAMKTQADLLRQMHERQRLMEEVVRDDKRHELVVNSAQALNDSFRGMQESQERLADRLSDARGGGGSRARTALIVVALVVVAGALVALALELRKGAGDLGSVAKKLEVPQADAEARAALAVLEARLQEVEAADRGAAQAELDRLRNAFAAAAVERDALRRERDVVREELGLYRGRAGAAEKSAAEVNAKFEAAEKEIARLTTQALADQRLLGQLNNAVDALKQRGAATAVASPPPVTPGTEGTAPAAAPAPPGEGVLDPAEITKTLERLQAGRDKAGESAGADGVAAAKTGEEASVAKEDPRELPFSPGQRDEVNRLLARHRGPAKYTLVSAARIYDRKLKSAVVEVRGADGSLDKTIEAESMTIKVSPRGEMLDLDFETGHVVFHGATAGRDAKSPFFNGRYQIVLLGAPVKDWLAAGLVYVTMK